MSAPQGTDSLFAPKADDFSSLYVLKARLRNLIDVKLKGAKPGVLVAAEWRAGGCAIKQIRGSGGVPPEAWPESSAELVFTEQPKLVELCLWVGTTKVARLKVDMEFELVVDQQLPLLAPDGSDKELGGFAALRVEILPMFPNVREQEAWQHALVKKTEKLENVRAERAQAALEQQRLQGLVDERADSLYEVERQLRKVQRETKALLELERKKKQLSGEREKGDAELDVSEIREAEYSRIFVVEAAVLWARNLRAADFLGKSDPYAVVEVRGVQQKTEVVLKSLEPQWARNRFRFVFSALQRPSSLKLTVWDWNKRQAHEQLGDLEFQLDENKDRIFGWFALKNAKKGEVQLGLEMHEFVPNEGPLKRSKAEYFETVDAIDFAQEALRRVQRDAEETRKRLEEREKELERQKLALEEEQRRLEEERKRIEEEEKKRKAEEEANRLKQQQQLLEQQKQKQGKKDAGASSAPAESRPPSNPVLQQEQQQQSQQAEGAAPVNTKPKPADESEEERNQRSKEEKEKKKGGCCVIL